MKSKIATLLVGMLLGAMLLGGAAIATELVVLPTTSTVLVDGVEKEVDAYNINGNNYFKLRDFTAAIDMGVWFDGENNTIHIETDKTYDADYTGPAAPAEPTAPAEGEEVVDTTDPAPEGEVTPEVEA